VKRIYIGFRSRDSTCSGQEACRTNADAVRTSEGAHTKIVQVGERPFRSLEATLRLAREGKQLQLTRLSGAIFDAAEDIEELTACAALLAPLKTDDQWGLLCLKLGIFDEVSFRSKTVLQVVIAHWQAHLLCPLL